MSDATSTLALLLQLLSRATASLADALATADATIALMGDLGLAVDTAPVSLTNLQAPLNTLSAKEAALEAALAANAEDSPAVLNAVADLAAASVSFFQAVLALPAALEAEFAGDPAILAAINSTFGRRLFDTLVITFAASSYPAISTILTLLGIIETAFIAGDDPESGNPVIIPPHISRTIHFDRIETLVQAPQNVMQTVYGWGTPEFAFTDLLRAVQYLCTSTGLRAGIYGPDAASTAALETPAGNELRAALMTAALDAANIELGIAVTEAPSTTAADTDRGVLLRPYFTGTAGAQIPLTDAVTLDLSGDFTASTGVALALRPPPGGFQILAGFLSGGAGGSAAAHIKLTLSITPASRIPLVSQADLFTLDAAGLGFSVNFDAGATFGVGIGVSLTGGKFAVRTGQADGFLQKVLPAGGLTVPFDIGPSWSTMDGLTFSGAAALSITVPLHVTVLDTITLDSLAIAAGTKQGSSGLFVSARLDAGANIGPISASVQGLGAEIDLTFPSAGGNLGPADASLTFVPPTGLGLEIDADAVSGGGFVSFDTAQQQYAGGLELSIEVLQLKAFGLLNTKPEVSFVIIISADFPPIELGFGFALSGVGGLLGINRSMALDPLRAAFRAHTLDEIVFLKGDIAAEAPTLIKGVAAIFPPLEQHFVVGPFVTITWSDPPIVSAELGIILSLPDPVTLAILGAIVVAVPDPDDALILLNLDVLGTWDVDAKQIAIDASLYDSYVAAFAVAGDTAFRLNYGDSPGFALSVGGLNPQFQPPPKFPTLKRMSISLGVGDNPSISVQGYFAVTGNSVQFGASAVLTAHASGFGVHGALAFDVLIILTPFGFTIDLHAELDVMAGSSVLMSIHLDGLLSGPTPWHVHGDASFSILFFSISVNIDATFGQSAAAQNPPLAQTIPPFQKALQDARNWSATLPQDAGRVATLAAPPASLSSVVVHPLGQIGFRQTVVPLNLTISKFGNATPSDATLFSATGVSLNGATTALGTANTLQDEFADGQYFAMSDQDKISKPSYTPHDSGAIFSSGTVLAPTPIQTNVIYDSYVEDDPVVGPTEGPAYQPYHSTVVALSGTGASARSPRRHAGAQRYVTPGLKSAVSVNADSYEVVSAIDGTVRTDILPAGASYYEAQAALQQYLSSHPSEVHSLQIFAAYELAA